MRKALLFALAGSALAFAFLGLRAVSPPDAEVAVDAGGAAEEPSAGPVVRFESSPAGAAVTGPGGLLGTTPFNHPLQGGTAPKSVVFSLPGHFTRQLNLTPEQRMVRVDLLKK